MPSWNEIREELIVQSATGDNDALGTIRRKYLSELSKLTQRNVITYYSGFINSGESKNLAVDDNDLNYFMRVIQGLDKSKGLDLLLHTPGGGIAATEALVGYLRKVFGYDIRAIVPQIAMSAGTMIACSCKSIVMGKHSSLGPIDPQFGGMPAQAVLKEFRKAIEEMDEKPNSPGTFSAWRIILSQYPPTLIPACEHSIEWSEKMVSEWLESNMFSGLPDATTKAEAIVSGLSDHSQMKSHSRHIQIDKCKQLGLVIEDLEGSQDFQEAVLSVHHTYMHTFEIAKYGKIVENHCGQTTIVN